MSTTTAELEQHLTVHARHLRGRGYTFTDDAGKAAIGNALKAAAAAGPFARDSERREAATKALTLALADARTYPAADNIEDDPFTLDDVKRQRTFRVSCTATTASGEETRVASVVVADLVGMVRSACQRRGHGERLLGRYTLEDHQTRMKHAQERAEAEAEAEAAAAAADEAVTNDDGEAVNDDAEQDDDSAIVTDPDDEDAEIDAPPAAVLDSLPDGIPPNAVAPLHEAGIHTTEALRAYADENAGEFVGIKGIGLATSQKIKSALADMMEPRDESQSQEPAAEAEAE